MAKDLVTIGTSALETSIGYYLFDTLVPSKPSLTTIQNAKVALDLLDGLPVTKVITFTRDGDKIAEATVKTALEVCKALVKLAPLYNDTIGIMAKVTRSKVASVPSGAAPKSAVLAALKKSVSPAKPQRAAKPKTEELPA